mmetsp:Transcript_18061/g.25725  ORF Transcript_18061/g.25725 Transcript_18061/m.25725 type:complete len:444 (-) Transcript_18061:119-1450(-)
MDKHQEIVDTIHRSEKVSFKGRSGRNIFKDNNNTQNSQFCFEEDISSVLKVATLKHHIDQDENDDNEKTTKAFDLRQRILIAFQPMLVRCNTTYSFTLKDAIIIGLLIFIVFKLLSSSGNIDGGPNVVSNANRRKFLGGRSNAIVKIPEAYELAFADVIDTLVKKTDTPLFFHVPRSAGITLQDVLSHCWNLVEASQVGTTHTHDKELKLQVWRHEDGGRYVNIDSTTEEGIQRAMQLNLPQSGLADVVYSSYLHPISAMFSRNYRARVFTLLRHPIHRAASMYFYLQDAVARGDASSELLYPTIEDYAKSPHMENNLVTRLLVYQMEGPLTPEHLLQAKELLKRKVLIGLTSNFAESLERFKYYFGWQQESLTQDMSRIHECEERLVKSGDNRHDHPSIEEESQAWNLLIAQNIYDMQLYTYAQTLFQEQGVQLFGVSETIV